MNKEYDIIIVGAGVSGLFCALQLAEDKRVLIVTKDEVECSNSYLAQGGIATLTSQDDFEAYVEDTLKAGRYENNKEAVELMIASSPVIIKDLEKLGVAFDREGEQYSYTREGAHSQRRILHHKDVTGKEMTSKLLQEVRKKSHIDIQPHTILLDLRIVDGECRGVLVKHQGQYKTLYAQKVVLATGGVGGLFENSTNQRCLTGDSLGIAIKHGIRLRDIEYIQIHPTTLYTKQKGRRFLISEAVRGEGAILLNSKQERFVNELLPRDIVASAIQNEMIKWGVEYIWLSMTHLEENFIKNRFPNIYQKCLEEGYDLTKEPIPIVPAQHYFMGGIEVDTYGRSSMEHVFAIGETSCQGVHGANRLASNSLLESLVFAKRCGQLLNQQCQHVLNVHEVLERETLVVDEEGMREDYKKLVLEAIKRKDERFYAKWCQHDSQCG